ncbi:MAG: hypothetical protein ACJA01_003060 [Saprospiraceae bacterium]|jgi:uncharacterized protein YacL
MARNAMAIVVGLTVAFIVKWTHVSIDNRLFPFPSEIDQSDMEAVRLYFKELPSLSLILTVAFNALTVLCASYITVKVAATQHRNLALGIGLFLLVMSLVRLFTLPHPIWFMVVDICLYIPIAGLGFRLANKS